MFSVQVNSYRWRQALYIQFKVAFVDKILGLKFDFFSFVRSQAAQAMVLYRLYERYDYSRYTVKFKLGYYI
jgi:hypothetical protein